MHASFLASASGLGHLPPATLPEAAVAGRSNCGKSSLLNAVAGAHIARTSATPGRTRELLFFEVAARATQRFCLVDLPGYGYARASKELQHAWGGLLTGYIETRAALRLLLVLQDIRRAAADEERDLLRWAAERTPPLESLIVLTKADKLTKAARPTAAEAAKRAFALPRRPLLFSIHDPQAISELRATLLGRLCPRS